MKKISGFSSTSSLVRKSRLDFNRNWSQMGSPGRIFNWTNNSHLYVRIGPKFGRKFRPTPYHFLIGRKIRVDPDRFPIDRRNKKKIQMDPKFFHNPHGVTPRRHSDPKSERGIFFPPKSIYFQFAAGIPEFFRGRGSAS